MKFMRAKQCFMFTFVIAGVAAGLAAVTTPELAAAPAARPEIAAGQILFRRCAICHVSKLGISPTIGPNLAGVSARKAGVKSGANARYAFSSAMQKSNLVWDDKTLSQFIANPGKVVPGTKMTAAGITSAEDRAKLIGYLKSLK